MQHATDGSADFHFNEATRLRKEGNFDEALEQFRSALAIDPDYLRARTDMALLLHNHLNQSMAALDELDEAARRSPQGLSGDPHFFKRFILLELGRYSEAAAELRAAIDHGSKTLKRHFETTAKSHCQAGKQLRKEGRYEEALEQYQCGLMADPDYLQAKCDIALLLHHQLNRSAEGLAELNEMIPAAPPELAADGHYIKSVILIKLERYREAAFELRSAIGTAGNLTPFQSRNAGAATSHCVAATQFVDNGKYEEALEQFQCALLIDPEYWQARSDMALLLHYYLNRSSDALREIDTAVLSAPELAKPHHTKGLLLRDLQREREAVYELKLAVEAEPTESVYHFDYGACLLHLDEIDAAITEFRLASSVDPSCAPAQSMLAEALLKKGEPSVAIEELWKALEVDPGHPYYLYQLGEVYSRTGRHDFAIEKLERAVEIEPLFWVIHPQLYREYLAVGNIRKFLSTYWKYLRLRYVQRVPPMPSLVDYNGRRVTSATSPLSLE